MGYHVSSQEVRGAGIRGVMHLIDSFCGKGLQKSKGGDDLVGPKHLEGNHKRELELAYGIDFAVGLLINLDLGCNAVTKVYFAKHHM